LEELALMTLILTAIVLCEVILRLIPRRQVLEFEPDSDLLWRFRPNQKGSFSARPPLSDAPEATIDARGLRSNRCVEVADTHKLVLCLGASETLGVGVSDTETFSALLQQSSQGRLRVLNAATSGWGIFQYESYVFRYIDQIRPDYVLIATDSASVFRQPFSSAQQHSRFLRAFRIRARLRRYSKLATLALRLLQNVAILFKKHTLPNLAPDDGSGQVSSFERCLEEDLRRLHRTCDRVSQAGAMFGLAIWRIHNKHEDLFVREMRKFACQRKIDFVDFGDALSQFNHTDLYIPGDGHPTALAHECAATVLFPVVSATLRLNEKEGSAAMKAKDP